jgi:hypothetical protein
MVVGTVESIEYYEVDDGRFESCCMQKVKRFMMNLSSTKLLICFNITIPIFSVQAC